MVDIATGEVTDREPTPDEQGKDPAAVMREIRRREGRQSSRCKPYSGSTPGVGSEGDSGALVVSLGSSPFLGRKERFGYHSLRPQIPRPTLTISPFRWDRRVITAPIVFTGSAELRA